MNGARVLIDQLVEQGVTLFCIAPGSRSTPLAIAAKEHPKAKTKVHFDERGLGFYALGFGLGSKKPAAVIVTSGSAAANLLPSVMEAHHSLVPMIVLTADRPLELLHRGSNQTTLQDSLFHPFVRFKASLSPSSKASFFRSIGAAAHLASIQNPPGPVHLNCHFDEPLYPLPPALGGTQIPYHLGTLTSPVIKTEAKRGLILIGKIPTSPKPILELGKRLKWPILGDILSNARLFPSKEQIRSLYQKPTPELILHFGERMTRIRSIEGDILHISPYPFLIDPLEKNPGRVQADISSFCQTFQAETDDYWLSEWAEKALPLPQTEEEMWMDKLSPLIDNNQFVFLGNSLPIRNGDQFLFPKKCRGFFASRGVSGIDGQIATMAGLSESLDAPMIGILGDQTALHDLNSFPLLKNRDILLIISNNFGGGIFKTLPIVDSPHFQELFQAHHSWNFELISKMFDLPYIQAREDMRSLPHSGILEVNLSQSLLLPEMSV